MNYFIVRVASEVTCFKALYLLVKNMEILWHPFALEPSALQGTIVMRWHLLQHSALNSLFEIYGLKHTSTKKNLGRATFFHSAVQCTGHWGRFSKTGALGICCASVHGSQSTSNFNLFN